MLLLDDGPIDGLKLSGLLEAAAADLTARAAAIDAINVYPVPDGDTGSNMAATLREAVRQATAEPHTNAGEVLRLLARGALYGARGNSGVILSQALRGLAAATEGKAALDAAALTAALKEAARMAYLAVGKPVEGTMLTVLRAAADGASGETWAEALRSAVSAAEAAEAATPAMLPALAEAGVTDAGGEGICVILRGLRAALTGEDVPEATTVASPPSFEFDHDHEGFGFCTEFLIEQGEAGPVDLDALRAALERSEARSLVIVGDGALARVHAHAEAPEALIAEAGRLGRLSRVKVEDMTRQHERFATTSSGAGARVALLALSPGAGFDAIFESLGAHTHRLEAVAKPSAGELAAAADALRCPDVVLLPNHPNVVLAAGQAVGLAACTITVVNTVSVPQGIAAALAFDPRADLAAATARIVSAAAAVHTVEVTEAAADRSADGVAVRAGDAIVLVDGTLRAAADTPEAALLLGLQALNAHDGATVTVYTGEGCHGDGLAESLAGSLGSDADISVTDGGQQLYAYIASVEW